MVVGRGEGVFAVVLVEGRGRGVELMDGGRGMMVMVGSVRWRVRLVGMTVGRGIVIGEFEIDDGRF